MCIFRSLDRSADTCGVDHHDDERCARVRCGAIHGIIGCPCGQDQNIWIAHRADHDHASVQSGLVFIERRAGATIIGDASDRLAKVVSARLGAPRQAGDRQQNLSQFPHLVFPSRVTLPRWGRFASGPQYRCQSSKCVSRALLHPGAGASKYALRRFWGVAKR